MIGLPASPLDPLPPLHPCLGCGARAEAVCSVLDCDNLEQFRKLGSELRLGAGQTLFREGDPATRVFTIRSGSLRLSALMADGRRQVVGFLGVADFLGISVDDQHAFTAETLEDTELCSFPRSRFDAFVEEHPALERKLYRMAAHELGAAQLQLVLLGRKTAAERLATFLLHLSERAGRLGDHEPDIVELRMNRADIADYLGLTKETVSRMLSTFRAARLVRLIEVDKVQILDRSALEQLADFES